MKGLSGCCGRVALVASAGWLLLLVSACGGGGEREATTTDGAQADTVAAQGEELPVVEVHALWAWGDAENLGTLTASADVVFRGRVIALKGQSPAIPQAGGAEAGGPGPRWADFPVSQFEVHVEKVISGTLNPGSTVIFEQAGGVQTRPDGSQVRLVLERDELVAVGEKYLFFAKIREDGVLEAAPFARMKVSADGRLSAGAGWQQLGALQHLSRLRLEDAERDISAAAGD